VVGGPGGRAPTYLAAAGRVLAAAGFGTLIALALAGILDGQWPIPGGDVANFLAAGERLRAGGAVYVGGWDLPGTVYYSPPIAVLFAAASFLPGWLVWILLVAVDVAGLRYLAGSWTRVGWLALCPVTVFQLVSGNPNFAIVAAILAADRGHVWALALSALAKVGPAVALPIRRWRSFGIVMLVALIVTVPWLDLWPSWIRFLLAAPRGDAWPTIVPFAYRVPVVIVLLAVRRPWARMLAGGLAIPGFYVVTAWAVTILAWRLWLDRRRPGHRGRDRSGYLREPVVPVPGSRTAWDDDHSGSAATLIEIQLHV